MIVNYTAYVDGCKLPGITLEDIPMLRDRP
ncbi:MAG: hypothetical protein H6R23_1795, partial [Proteobacteria bacterium]|nr:hypothetical protein [Pseudomonadota bacterium]